MSRIGHLLTNTENADSEFPLVLRYAAYTLLIFSAATSLPLILQYSSIAAFKEGGGIETKVELMAPKNSLVSVPSVHGASNKRPG